MEKKLKVNISHYDVSPTPRSEFIQVNIFSRNHLVKMSIVSFADGQYCNDITCSCTTLQMQCMCISMCLVLCLFTRLVEIFIALLLSHKMTMGESNANPISPRIPCNHTHCVDAFTAPLYSALDDERDIMCCLLLEQNMGPCVGMNT